MSKDEGRKTVPQTTLSAPALESLRAALEFAHASGAWLVAGAAPAEVPSVMASTEAEPRELGREPPPGDAASTLAAVRKDLGDCRRCRLSAGRRHLVFGVGDPKARLMFVGEGPGEEEDRQGEPFVGRAGKLLDRMITALGLGRADVYIANVVKCRPPGNREPAEEEAAACSPFLWRQIEAVAPKVICTLGAHASRTLLGTSGALGSLRGRSREVRGHVVLPTYHPAYLLRNPAAKRLAWDDLRKVRELLGREGLAA